jgi:hypothetical protein
MRCHQIRDKYDYLILHYSGGSDSHNMLNYFYRNSIHIDEIITALPITYFEKYKSPDSSTHAKDSHNEWFHVVKPDLAWIAKHMPKTKITTYDYTDDMINFNVDQDWIYHAGEHINPNITNRIQRYYKIETANVYDRYRVGHLYGLDKPLVFKRDDGWYTAFLDSVISVSNSVKPVADNHTHISVEYFYWSPDLPQMLIKQAHLLKKYYETNPQFMDLASFRALTPEEFELQQTIIKTAIYPYWRNEIFQVKKASNTFFKEFDQWFFDMADSVAKHRWQEGYRYLMQQVPNNWINRDTNGSPSGIKGIWSQWHQLDSN